MNLQFHPGIIEYKRKISVALLHYIMTTVHIVFGILKEHRKLLPHCTSVIQMALVNTGKILHLL